jgi:hypothetical protein
MFCGSPRCKNRSSKRSHRIARSWPQRRLDVSRAFHPAALEDNAPAFRSLHFLAPAIRVDAFEQRLLDKIGAGKRRC